MCTGMIHALALRLFLRGYASLRAACGQIRQVIIQYIDALPQRPHEVFLDLAIEALQLAWPCQKSANLRKYIALRTFPCANLAFPC
jgi:hypothetical protein